MCGVCVCDTSHHAAQLLPAEWIRRGHPADTPPKKRDGETEAEGGRGGERSSCGRKNGRGKRTERIVLQGGESQDVLHRLKAWFQDQQHLGLWVCDVLKVCAEGQGWGSHPAKAPCTCCLPFLALLRTHLVPAAHMREHVLPLHMFYLGGIFACDKCENNQRVMDAMRLAGKPEG
eukprot:356295-Chlamydomonas_euryale.AAC.3